MANLQQASTLGIQIGSAPVYDSDGTSEILEPIAKPHQVQQNNSNAISDGANVEQSRGTLDQNLAPAGEVHAHFESLYNNLVTQVEKVNQINALHLISAKQITALNEEIANLNNQLLKEKSVVSRLEEDKKKLKSDFKIREDELLDKQIKLEKKIKELDNILLKQGQTIQTMHMLTTKPYSFYHTEQKMALGYPNPYYLKQAPQKQQSLYNGRVLLDKHDPPVANDSEETLQLA
ncbi:hypothetical protein Tco_1139181 [Tanacetum coccineum]